MLNLGRFKVPPIKNMLDVAMQTVRQQVPDKPGPPPRPPQNVRFANLGKKRNKKSIEKHYLNVIVANDNFKIFFKFKFKTPRITDFEYTNKKYK